MIWYESDDNLKLRLVYYDRGAWFTSLRCWKFITIQGIKIIDSDLLVHYTFVQSSLMYKLHQIYVGRGKFRLTIFPGTIDRALIVALFVIFLSGRK